MASSGSAVGEPMVLGEVVPRRAVCSGKVVALLSLLVGLAFTVFWFGGVGQQMAIQEPVTDLTLQMPAARAKQFMQPVRAQVGNVQDKLAMFPSINSGPLANLGIKSIELMNAVNGRCRDVSANAEKTEAAKEAKAWIDAWRATPKGDQMVLAGEAATLDPKTMAGITPPLGFFDLGFTTTCPEGKLRFYREVELKHGRVCMLASLGILVQEKFHPLFGGNIDTLPYKAFQETPLQNFWPAVLLAIAIPEVYSIFTFNNPAEGYSVWTIKSDHEPGNLGYDPLGLKPKDPKAYLEMQNKELNNGRLAMIGTVGMIVQEMATQQRVW